jgi:cell division protein FtsN
MSEQDRGAYTPPSDRLSFDPREPVRSGGPAPVTLIVSGVVLLAIVGGVFLLYRGGIRHKGDAPVAVGEPIAQMKSPAPPDANDIPPGLVISKVDASNMTAANATFAPPPEEPLPRPLPVQAPSVVTSTPLPPPMAGAPQRLALPPAAPRTIAATTAKPAKPVTIASLTDDAMAQKPAAPKTPPAPPTITPPAPVAAAPPSGGDWVQIGAFSSSALADKGWSDVAALAPAGMSGKGRRVEPVSKDGKTFYRTYVTGFASRDAAQAFCDRLKAAGKACFVK